MNTLTLADTSVCRACGVEKITKAEFYPEPRTQHGYRRVCIACTCATERTGYHSHAETFNARRAAKRKSLRLTISHTQKAPTT